MSRELQISVIIPAMDEEESLPELCKWISRVMEKHGFSYEVIMIDDGSTDATWDKITEINLTDGRFIGIRFNRNFG
jgi:glycosyltransferase involved in cell wall biosynthesis